MPVISRVRNTYNQFPKTFWTLAGATFIDHVGGAMLFPFFALYVTEHFGVGMTEVGILFAVFAMANLLGGLVGGAFTDKFGRRWMIMFGLVVSALSSLLMALVNDIALFYGLAALVGLLANAGGPAQQAMVADLLDEDKRTEGFGILRVVVNLAVVIGPAIGGLLAAQSYIIIFVSDAVTSIITAVIVYFAIPETKPKKVEGEVEESVGQTIVGYQRVLRDQLFMAFILVSMLAVIVYNQMNSTLSVFLRDVYGLTAREYGYLLSINAGMVVLFQFWITKQTSSRPPMLMMALGTLLYAIGFALYGFVATFLMFVVAMVIITVGEMITAPLGQMLVAHFAPEDMRGRYMAIYGFSWTLPFAVGPLLAGVIMDNANPNWVWYASGIVAMVSVLGYLWLYSRTKEVILPKSVEQSSLTG